MADRPLAMLRAIPVVSRFYFAAIVAVTVACTFDVISPLSLYYNLDLILHKGQYWRLLTNFLYFGSLNIDFLLCMLFTVRYFQHLEEGAFRGRPADFALMVTFGAVSMLVLVTTVDYFARIKFLGFPLTYMMMYIWSRDPDNAHHRMGLFGVIVFSAPFLPWVMLGIAVLRGSSMEMDVLGMLVGHVYYFLDFVYPEIALVRRWRVQRIMEPPVWMHRLFTPNYAQNDAVEVVDLQPAQHLHQE